MGMTHVTMTVRNPADPQRTWEGLFLVNAGAVDCLVPAKHLREIGFLPPLFCPMAELLASTCSGRM